MKWHKMQDRWVSYTLKRLEDVNNHLSPTRRMWAISDKLLLEKHFTNICALYKQNERFRILDIGCGTGELISRLSNYFRNVEFVGVDSNKDSIICFFSYTASL